MGKIIKDRFSGRDLLETDIFGFYWTGYDEDGEINIDIKKSMDNIIKSFKDEFFYIINKKLNQKGFKLNDVTYYSPRAYNYCDDELDFHISSLAEGVKSIKNVSIDEMIDIFKELKITADDLGINTDWIYDKFIYEKNGEEE